MKRFPIKVEKKLELRKQQNSFRNIGSKKGKIDFSSNDYLRFSTSLEIFEGAHKILLQKNLLKNGSTGSRLLTGNHELYPLAEEKIADFHNAEAALIFNSGYDANIGFFGSVPQRGDVVLYDELVHASIRDGLQLSAARSFKFRHNDLHDLEAKLKQFPNKEEIDVFVVTEAIFSMDGDQPDLAGLVKLSEELGFFLVLDEAHSFGVLGENGKGSVELVGLEKNVFARIITFGKALGAHGAVVLGSNELRDYLINFSRSFIYTTALPPHALATIMAAYDFLQQEGQAEVQKLQENIRMFTSEVKKTDLAPHFIPSVSAIHCCLVPGNDLVKALAEKLQKREFDVRPILSPTVPEGKERIRFCIHSTNSSEEIKGALSLLANELSAE